MVSQLPERQFKNCEVNMNESKTLEPDMLIQQLQDAAIKARQQDDPALKCAALMKLGQAYLDKKEAPDALTQFEEALKIALETDDLEVQARLLGYKGLALKMLGNYTLALQAFRKSNGMAAHLGHKLLLCDSYLQLGTIKFKMEKQDEAQADLTQALEIATEEHDSNREMRIASELADNFYSLKNFTKTREYYSLACEQARNMGDLAAECFFLTKMGNASLSFGELKTAIGQYERALNIASVIQNRNAEINILGGLFRAHALAKDVGLATFYGEKVLQLAGEIQHFEAEITTIHALATFFIDQAQYSKAISYLDQGRKLAEQNQDQGWLLTLTIAAGTALYRSGEYPAAVEVYQQAINLARSSADKRSEARVLGYLSVVHADQDSLIESIKSAESALDLAREFNDSSLTAEQQMLLALNYRELDQVDKAIQYCQAAIASYKDIRSSEMVEKAEALLAELQSATI
jgi:tetratricopeptide (TPR) repeat protein